MSNPKCEHCDREDILQENAAILTQYDAVTKERDILKATLKATTRADDQIQNDAAAEIKALTAERDALRAQNAKHVAAVNALLESGKWWDEKAGLLEKERDALRQEVERLHKLCDYGAKTMDELEATIKRLREALDQIANNFDHDSDAHKYGTPCRTCVARAALRPV